MDQRQLDLEELKALTAGAESGGFSLADILADYGTGSESGVQNPGSGTAASDSDERPAGRAEIRNVRKEEPRAAGGTFARAAGGGERARTGAAAAAAGRGSGTPTASRQQGAGPYKAPDAGFSVDDILAEFYSGRESAAPAAAPSPAPAPAPRRREAPSQENRSNRVKDNLQENRTEPLSPAGAPKKPAEAPKAEPAAPSWSFERKSSLPSEAEIRAFLADYAAENPDGAGASESFDADARYRIGENRRSRRELRYDGKSVDLGAEAGYVPPEAPEYISSYAPEEARDEEDEEVPDEAPRFGFLSRLRDRFDRERGAYLEKEERRRKSLEKKPEIHQVQEMELPGESGIRDSELAADPDATQIFERPEKRAAEGTFASAAGGGESEQKGVAAAPGAGRKSGTPAALRQQGVGPYGETGRSRKRPAESETTESEPRPRQPQGRHAAKPTEKTARRVDAPYGEKPDDTNNPEFQTPDPEFDLSPAWTKKLADHQPYASAFPDTSANPAVYAVQNDYEYEDEEDAHERSDEGRALLEEEDFFPPTFKEYILQRLTVLLYRLRGGRKVSLTAEEDDEDLGPEIPPAKASKYYGSFLRSMRLRLRVCGAVLLVMAWISLGLPVTGRFNDTAVAALFCLAAQLTVMLLCLDVVVKAFTNALRGRFGADFMAVLVCVVTSLDALLSSLAGFGQVHLPLCLLSSLSLTGILLSSYMSCQGLRKALRVPAIARRSYTVTGETSTKTGDVTLLKSVRPVKGFVRRSEEAAPDETLFTKISLPLLALVLLLTVVTVIAKRNARDIFYILSVLLVPAVPFTALLAFAIPFAQGSRRLFPSGAAVAGWSGVVDIGQSKNLVVTDRDLFPDGTVELDTVRIFADVPPERIISYAGSLLCASGSGVSGCFADLMQRKNCPMRQIENFEVLPGGGLKGIIDSSIVLCGSTDLMQLMNVRIPYRLVSRQSVLLAVDGVLYGIFNMKYTPDNRVRSALLGLMRSGRHPVFAIRDFNVTPAMLHDTFEVATDGYDFPPYVDRFPMSEGAPGPDSKVAAVVCREGLGPLSDTADFGRRMYVYTRVNLYAALLSAVLGVLVSFIRLLAAGGVSVGFLLVFMAVWSVPAILTGASLRVE